MTDDEAEEVDEAEEIDEEDDERGGGNVGSESGILREGSKRSN